MGPMSTGDLITLLMSPNLCAAHLHASTHHNLQPSYSTYHATCTAFLQVKDTPEAPGLAQANLKAMGPMSKGELITLATISGAVVLWMFGDAIGCPAVLAAMLALATLLCTGVAFWGGGPRGAGGRCQLLCVVGRGRGGGEEEGCAVDVW
jgi:hypothetical protein